MSENNTSKYIEEINFLKNKYKGKIEIYLGTECDLFSSVSLDEYDYIIGSVHYVKAPDGKLHCVDDTEEVMLNTVNSYFNGSFLEYTKAYYSGVAKLKDLKPDIIGHFDIIAKFNEGNKFFDENSKTYLDLAFEAIDAVISHCNLFEINTGAMAKGYRTVPYPSIPLLKRLYEKGARITLSSDCHDADFLNYYYKESIRLLKEIGFKSAYALLGGKFTEYPL